MAEAAQALDKDHGRRYSGPGHLRRVVQRAAGQPVAAAVHLDDGLLADIDQRGVEVDRFDPPDALPLDGYVLVSGDVAPRLPGPGEHLGQRAAVQMALVERDLAPARDGGHDAGV